MHGLLLFVIKGTQALSHFFHRYHSTFLRFGKVDVGRYAEMAEQ